MKILITYYSGIGNTKKVAVILKPKKVESPQLKSEGELKNEVILKPKIEIEKVS